MAKQKCCFFVQGTQPAAKWAEAFLREYAEDKYEVHNAGFEPKGIHYTIC